ncbi:MAG TPA: hypothetical protein VMZ71_14055, partial [Gemmataceae bacterium]|nr:hypothetical protein [Gemmataceae bacterium]
ASDPYEAADNVFNVTFTGFGAAVDYWGVTVFNGNVDVIFGAVPVPEPGEVMGVGMMGIWLSRLRLCGRRKAASG